MPYYPFNSNWIVRQKFNWQINFDIRCNKSADQFILLNSSVDPLEDKNKSVYVHGPKFREYLKMGDGSSPLAVPAVKQFKPEATIELTRNASIKEQLFYQIQRNNEVLTYCCRYEHELESRRCKQTAIPVTDYSSSPDCWLHSKCQNNDHLDVFQSVKVDSFYRYMQVETRKPADGGKDGFVTVRRQSDMMNQQVANYPFIAHNLGQQRLVLINQQTTAQPKAHIISIEPDEKFVSFVEFNQYADIGFYPANLNIQCCSGFLFLTTKKNANRNDATKLNLLLADPYYDRIQAAMFKSTSSVNDDIFLQEDLIVKAAVTSTMVMRADADYKLYLWTQFPSNLLSQPIRKAKGEGGPEDG